jgi:3-oxoacyl-[acyl-carrier-protein] synthase III
MMGIGKGPDMDKDVVGIAGLGRYLPARTVDAWEAVEESGMSREQYERTGAARLHLAAEGEMPSSMAAEASRQALEDAGMSPEDVDLIIYTGSVKDHSRWQASNKVQADLEAFNSYVFDLYQGAGGQNLALSVAQSMVRDDPEIQTVLIAAAERWDTSLEVPVLGHSLIFGDGASAAVLRRGHPDYRLRSWAHTTRGEHHAAFCIPDVGAGTRLTPEVFERGGHYFQKHRPKHHNRDDVLAFVEEFNQTGVETFDRALRKAGARIEDVAFVVMINTSLAHNRVFLERLGVPLDRSSAGAVGETGLLGTGDIFYNLRGARSKGMVKKGDLVALYTVGSGYSWGVSLLLA